MKGATTWCLALLLLLLAVVALGDDSGDPTVAVGSRVRIRAPTLTSDRIEGTLIGVDESTFLVESKDRERLTVPRDAVTHLAVSAGQRRWKLRGALIGAGFGLLAIGAGGSQASPLVTCSALLGTGIGALVRSDRWQKVPLDRVHASVTPLPRGVALTVSFAF